MSQLKVKFDASGHRNGAVCNAHEFCNGGFDSCIIESTRWYQADVHEQEAILLGVVRQRYPEVTWESASAIEVKQI